MEVKFCNKCSTKKSLFEFGKSNRSKDGLQSKCKECDKDYRNKNKSKIAKYMSEYNIKNRDLLVKKKRQYRIENIDEIRRRDRLWSIKNKEKVRANQEKQWSLNRKKYYAKAVERCKLRRSSDDIYYLKGKISHRVRMAMKGIGLRKGSATSEMIGCTWEEFHLHIERQFQKGMTWKNRNLWHIDHIIPLATATCEDDIIRLNHFTNLRPLWAEDNLRKSDKLEYIL
jgi:transposase-like protein